MDFEGPHFSQEDIAAARQKVAAETGQKLASDVSAEEHQQEVQRQVDAAAAVNPDQSVQRDPNSPLPGADEPVQMLNVQELQDKARMEQAGNPPVVWLKRDSTQK